MNISYLLFLLTIGSIIIVLLIAWVHIFRNAGYRSGLSTIITIILGLLMLHPTLRTVILILTLLFLALSKWPLEKEVERLQTENTRLKNKLRKMKKKSRKK